MMSAAAERVIGCLQEVFQNKSQTAPELGPQTALDRGLGLDSLDYAELIVRLADAFGADPFAAGRAPGRLETVADLAALYEEAPHYEKAPHAEDQPA